MAELTIDLTYGNALFMAASESGKKDQILDECCQVLGIFEQEPNLYALINYPGVSAKEKKEILKKVFEGRICKEVLNLLYVLVDKGRTRHFPKIVKAFKNMINHEEGCSYGTIYSVTPLTAPQLEKVEAQVSDLLQTRTRLENELDPKLMGGIKILVDGRMIDASLRKRLEDLRNKIV